MLITTNSIIFINIYLYTIFADWRDSHCKNLSLHANSPELVATSLLPAPMALHVQIDFYNVIPSNLRTHGFVTKEMVPVAIYDTVLLFKIPMQFT